MSRLPAGRIWFRFLVEARHSVFNETSRPALGPARTPAEWLPGLCGGEKRLGIWLITHLPLVLRLGISGAIPPLPMCVCMDVYVCVCVYIYIYIYIYILSIEGGSSRSHYVEESFWKRLWTCHLTDYWWWLWWRWYIYIYIHHTVLHVQVNFMNPSSISFQF